MSEDFISFEQELLNTSREAIELSKAYLEARKNCSHCLNQLQTLIYKADLHTSKKSPENKIIELMADKELGETATKLNKAMQNYEAEYKGLEMCVKAYLAHCSALQSVIKTQISAEINENVRAKYNRGPNEV